MHNLRNGKGLVVGAAMGRMADRVKAWLGGSQAQPGGTGMMEGLEARTLMSAYVVTDATDDIYAAAVGSLRWAIDSANGDRESSSISFNLPAGTTSIQLKGSLSITNSVTIDGPGSGALSLDAQGLGRVMEISGGDVSLEGLTITGGAVTDAHGAGIMAYGNNLTLQDMVITGNKGTDTGYGGSVSVMGVGLYSRSPAVTIVDSVISNNAGDGGGLGIGAYFEASGPGATVAISNTVVTGNLSTVTTTTTAGVGLFFTAGLDAVLVKTRVESNHVEIVNQDISSIRGVGIANEGSLGLSQSIVHNNTATTPGTYVYVHGGGIYSNNVLNISQSEVSYNSLGRGPGAGVFAYGTLNVLNSTVAYNSVLTSGQGAGVYYGTNGATGLDAPTLHFSTVYGNSVGDDYGSTTAGGIYADASNPMQLINSIVAGNTWAYNGSTASAADISGGFTAVGKNLVFDVSRGSVNGSVLTGVDPALDTELGFHGGPTRTLVPTTGSPAIDAADTAYSPGTDQRGFTRPVYGGTDVADLGAVEAGGILAGRIFHDVNGNGIYDEGDGYPSSGSNQVQVLLYSAGADGVAETGDEAFVDSVTVDLFGYYGFYNVGNGAYYLTFELPEGYHFGLQQLGTGGGSAVIPEGTQKGDTPVYTVVKGTYEEHINVSATADTLLQTQVYVDVNKNGGYDAGTDTVVAGVTVWLSDGETSTAGKTDTNGFVSFTNVQVAGGGIYSLYLADVPGYQPYAVTIGTLSGSSESASGVYGIVMPAGGQGTGYAFGITPNVVATASVTGVTFEDVNQSGVKDASEGVLEEVLVKLWAVGFDGIQGTGDDVFVEQALSGADGTYTFASLVANSYYVTFYAPSESPNIGRLTKQDVSTPGGSRADGSAKYSGNTPVYMLAEGEAKTDVNAGFVRYIAISVFVFQDTGVDPNGYPAPAVPGDGVYQSDVDPVLKAVSVTISGVADVDGTLITQTYVTNDFGGWYFYLLEPGVYTISVVAPAGLNGSQAFPGSLGGTASADNLSISGVTIGSGKVADRYVFAMMPPVGSIHGSTFEDRNQNGVQDGDEYYVSGVPVKLYEVGTDGVQGTADDVETGSTISDGSGFYSFESLLADDYYVVFDVPAGARFTKQDASSTGGSDPQSGSGANPGRTAVYTLAPGQNLLAVDAGYVKFASLTVLAFSDMGEYLESSEPITKENGVYDSGYDTVLEGVTVTIEGVLDVDGSPYSTTLTTDANGRVCFTALEPGVYTISVQTPDGKRVTRAIVGSQSGTAEANNSGVTGVTLGSGVTGSGYQFAFVPDTSLSGSVFYDANANGVWDSDFDSKLSEVTVHLQQSGDGVYSTVATVITDGDGNWVFTGLEGGGTYRVVEVLPGAYIVHASALGTAGGTRAWDSANEIRDITVEAYVSYAGYAFANIKPNTVWGRVIDSSDEGSGVAGATIQLLISDFFGTRTTTQTTLSDGMFSFSDLGAGTYALDVLNDIVGLEFDHAQAGPRGGTTGDKYISGIDLQGAENTSADDNYFVYTSEPVIIPVARTFDASNPLAYFDTAGNKVTLSMTGPGSGTAYFQGTSDTGGGGLLTLASAIATDTSDGPIQSILISGTTSKSSFRIDVSSASAGTAGATSVPSISINGDIQSVYAPNASFGQSLYISGGVGSITLGDVGQSDGPQAMMTLGHSSAFATGTTITLGLVNNLSIGMEGGRIAQLTAKNWLDDNAEDDFISAASINGLTISGAMGVAGVYGDFQADVLLSGEGVADDAPTLNLVNVAGAISDSVWNIEGNVERINTRSGGEEWTLNASGLVAYLTTSRSLIASQIHAQSIGLLSVRQHLLDTVIITGDGLTPNLFSMAGLSVGGTVINTQIDSQDTGLGTMLITGNIMEFSVRASTLTRLNTGVSMYDSTIEADLIGTIFVSLDMIGCSVHANQELADNKVSLGNLTVFAIAQDSSVISLGSVDNLRFGHLIESYVNVGLYDGEGSRYFRTTETGQVAKLNTLYLSATVGYTDYKAISDSDILVGHLGSARIYSVDEAVESNYGITAHSVDSYQRRRDDGTVLKLVNLENDDLEPEVVDQAGGYRLTLIEIPDRGD
jgi:hypothetical protein